MSESALTAVAVVALVVALVALGVALAAQRQLSVRRRAGKGSPLPTDVAGLRGEVEVMRQEAAGAVRRLALVRYDAFGDMGGRLSWSLAVTDDAGDGVVLTSIHGRSEARTYAKNVSAWSSDQQLSPEETEALTEARAR